MAFSFLAELFENVVTTGFLPDGGVAESFLWLETHAALAKAVANKRQAGANTRRADLWECESPAWDIWYGAYINKKLSSYQA